MRGKARGNYTELNEITTDKNVSMPESAKPEKAAMKEAPEDITKKLAQFRKWMKHKRYSESTVNTYADAVSTAAAVTSKA